MINFKIWFSNNNPKINIVLIKILVNIFVAKSEYIAEEINMVQGAVYILVEMFNYWLVTDGLEMSEV
jgi:hypothetical protein